MFWLIDNQSRKTVTSTNWKHRFMFCDKRSLKLARELNTSRFSSISCAIVATQAMITRPVTILSCVASEEVNFWRIKFSYKSDYTNPKWRLNTRKMKTTKTARTAG